MIIKSSLGSLQRVEKIIAGAILDKPEAVLEMTIAQFAKKTGVAPASVVRFCRKFGFDGYIQMKIRLTVELERPEEIILEGIKKSDSNKTVFSKVFSANIHTLEETLKGVEISEMEKTIEILCNAKKIMFFGIGSSEPIARDAYYRYMRIGLPACAEPDPHVAAIAANLLDRECAVIGISHSGRSSSTLVVLEKAKARGASVIAVTSSLGSPITKIADISLITYSDESRYMKEATSARLGHIAILDSILACIAMRYHKRSIKKTEELMILLDELMEN